HALLELLDLVQAQLVAYFEMKVDPLAKLCAQFAGTGVVLFRAGSAQLVGQLARFAFETYVLEAQLVSLGVVPFGLGQATDPRVAPQGVFTGRFAALLVVLADALGQFGVEVLDDGHDLAAILFAQRAERPTSIAVVFRGRLIPVAL